MDCQHLEDIYELFLLGIAARDDAAEIGEHLARGCLHCLGQLREAALTIYLLSQPARPVPLDPKRKPRLLRRLPKK